MVLRKESKFKEVPYQKLRIFMAAFGSYRSKTLKTVNFAQKNGQNLVLNGKNFAISEFFRHIEYDFLKEDQKNNSRLKFKKIHSGVWKLKAKNL